MARSLSNRRYSGCNRCPAKRLPVLTMSDAPPDYTCPGRLDPRLGSRAGLPADRHRRHRHPRGRRAPDALARAGPARRDGLHGAPRPAARAPAGARARHAARDLGAHGLSAARAHAMPRRCSTDPELGYVSRYALGRDYHKVLRRRLAQLAERIQAHSASRSHRVFVDSGRCWRRRSRATPASAGSASTPT